MSEAKEGETKDADPKDVGDKGGGDEAFGPPFDESLEPVSKTAPPSNAANAAAKNPHALVHQPVDDLSQFSDFFGSAVLQPRPDTPPSEPGAEGKDGSPQKKMTAAQMARWEREQERLRLIREEEERLQKEEEERAWNAPLIPRMVFDERTRVKMPSISPRDKLSYTSDKKYHKEIERFHEKNPSLHKFLVMVHQQIITAKPANILDYLAEEYLAEENIDVVRKEIARQETSLRELM